MTYIPLGKALAPFKDGKCSDCVLYDAACVEMACKPYEREDEQRVIFKLVDLTGAEAEQ